MKAPEEIKKALCMCRSIGAILTQCAGCPYRAYNGECKPGMEDDALNYIASLEEQVAKRDKLLAVMGVRIREDGEAG